MNPKIFSSREARKEECPSKKQQKNQKYTEQRP